MLTIWVREDIWGSGFLVSQDNCLRIRVFGLMSTHVLVVIHKLSLKQPYFHSLNHDARRLFNRQVNVNLF